MADEIKHEHNSPALPGFDLGAAYGLDHQEIKMPGINGGTTETLLISPENNKHKSEAIIVIPGFGNTRERLGQSFVETSEFLANKLGVTTAICLEDRSDQNISEIPEFGIQWALENSIRLLEKNGISKIHLVAYSNNGANTVIALNNLSEKIKSSIGSITLVAPTENPYEIVDTLEKTGSPVVYQEDGSVKVGNRGTKVSSIVAHSQPFTKTNFITNLIRSGVNLRNQGIPIKIFHGGENDGIVPLSQSTNLAKHLGIEVQVEKSILPKGAPPDAIHNFATTNLRKLLQNELSTHLGVQEE